MNIAHAHTRSGKEYSAFHQSLLKENEAENYALRHLYSWENTKVILSDLGWTPSEIKEAALHITIDVYENFVRVHVPGWIPVSDRQAKNYSVLDGSAKVINGKLCRKIRGISRFFSKRVYVDALIERCWQKADPYKLLPGNDWDEFFANGNTGDTYQLLLHPHHLTCDCKAFSGISKAFLQDSVALKLLMNDHRYFGQTPDKHVFAVWKYLNCYDLSTYSEAYQKRMPPLPSSWLPLEPELQT